MFTEQMVIQTDCQQLLRNKYLRTMSLTQVGKKPGDSQFWTSLMNVRDQFLTFDNFRL
jgi:hypothetical protein